MFVICETSEDNMQKKIATNFLPISDLSQQDHFQDHPARPLFLSQQDHFSHCEIKSHRIRPIWKPIPLRFSNLTEFSDHVTTYYMEK